MAACDPDLQTGKGVSILIENQTPQRVEKSYFFPLIDGVKLRPTNSPSGARKRLTVCPEGSFWFLTSIRWPRTSSSAVARSTLVKLKPSLWHRDLVWPGISSKTGLRHLRKRPQGEGLRAFNGFRMKIPPLSSLKRMPRLSR